MKTKLINYRTYNLDKSKIVSIDRRSLFGNPFIIGTDGNREEVIERYKEYFYTLIKNPTIKKEVLKLKGKTLGCWCTPLPCHGDIIIDYLNSLDKESLND